MLITTGSHSPERACSVTLRQRDSRPSSMFSMSAETEKKNSIISIHRHHQPPPKTVESQSILTGALLNVLLPTII